MPSFDVMEATVHPCVRALNDADLNAMVAGEAAYAFSVACFGPAKIGHA